MFRFSNKMIKRYTSFWKIKFTFKKLNYVEEISLCVKSKLFGKLNLYLKRNSKEKTFRSLKTFNL